MYELNMQLFILTTYEMINLCRVCWRLDSVRNLEVVDVYPECRWDKSTSGHVNISLKKLDYKKLTFKSCFSYRKSNKNTW